MPNVPGNELLITTSLKVIQGQFGSSIINRSSLLVIFSNDNFTFNQTQNYSIFENKWIVTIIESLLTSQ